MASELGTGVGGIVNPQRAQGIEELCVPVVLKQSETVHLKHVRNLLKEVQGWTEGSILLVSPGRHILLSSSEAREHRK